MGTSAGTATNTSSSAVTVGPGARGVVAAPARLALKDRLDSPRSRTSRKGRDESPSAKSSISTISNETLTKEQREHALTLKRKRLEAIKARRRAEEIEKEAEIQEEEFALSVGAPSNDSPEQKRSKSKPASERGQDASAEADDDLQAANPQPGADAAGPPDGAVASATASLEEQLRHAAAKVAAGPKLPAGPTSLSVPPKGGDAGNPDSTSGQTGNSQVYNINLTQVNVEQTLTNEWRLQEISL